MGCVYHRQNEEDSLTKETNQDAVKRARLAAALDVSKGRNTRIEAQTLSQNFLDIVDRDGLHVDIMCAFSNDDDRLTLANRTVLRNEMSTC